MASARISIIPPDEQAGVTQKIERELLRSLAGLNAQTTNASIVLAAQDSNGGLVGGVCGSTSYGWLLVKILWVDEANRGAGIGTDLLDAAEDQARRLGCHSAWLDTSSSRARDFYLRLGYAEFGVLENGSDKAPAGHCRWFLKKPLQVVVA